MSSDLEQFVEQDGREDQVTEVRREIDAGGVEYIYLQFVSVTGRIVGKGVPAQHWERFAHNGFQLVYGATANLFTDRHGEYIGYGAGQASSTSTEPRVAPAPVRISPPRRSVFR